jgi:flap endonuclease-1
MGFFYRTIRIVENGIKPAYVFDGKPPELKAGVVRINTCSRATSRGLMTRALQLAKRFERREEAKADGEEAKETGRLPHSYRSLSSSVPQAQPKTWNVSREEQSK